jgi:hypothetical protein
VLVDNCGTSNNRYPLGWTYIRLPICVSMLSVQQTWSRCVTPTCNTCMHCRCHTSSSKLWYRGDSRHFTPLRPLRRLLGGRSIVGSRSLSMAFFLSVWPGDPWLVVPVPVMALLSPLAAASCCSISFSSLTVWRVSGCAGPSTCDRHSVDRRGV